MSRARRVLALLALALLPFALLALADRAAAQEVVTTPTGWTVSTRVGRVMDVTALACSDTRAAVRSWSGAAAAFERGAWRALPDMPGSTRGQTYGREIAIAPSGEIFASASGRIAEWDGASWTMLEILDREAYAELGDILALSRADVYLVGRGRIWRRDGARFVAHDAGTWRDLSAIEGTSASDLWIAGQGGTVMRWDGRAWTRHATGTEGWISGLAVASPRDAWAWIDEAHARWPFDPDAATLFHWDGRAWTPVETPGSAPDVTTSLAARGGRVLAAADGSLFQREGGAWRVLAIPGDLGDESRAIERVCTTREHVVVTAAGGVLAHRPLPP